MDDETHSGLLEKVEDGSSTGKEGNVKDRGRSFKRDVWNVFLKYLDRSSMAGIPFIRSSDHKSVKAAWSLLLFVAFFVMVGHLVMLFASYYEYNTHSTVAYTFSPLPFPAVTFCNVNPVRKSMKDVTGDAWFFHIIADIEANITDNLPSISMDTTASDSDPGIGESSSMFDDFFGVSYDEIYSSETSTKPSNTSVEASLKGKSPWHRIVTMFKEIFSQFDDDMRFNIGHQLNDMIIECYYNGYNCNRSCFRQSSSVKYGNCYTIECASFSSSQSGPDKGLTLVLRLELDEYMPILSESKGAVLVVHERNTIAFPSEDGIALSAGSENMIGIREVELNRLQAPYGTCSPVELFQEEYGIGPTRTTCLKVCKRKMMIRECGCCDNMYPQINKVLNISKLEQNCSNPEQFKCIDGINQIFQQVSEKCGCNSPCSESKFDKTISTREWPSPDFTDLLVTTVCLKTPEACGNLTKKRKKDLENEFLKVNIYYEDLNHEVYTETPDYELTQFLSDIGGTIGLWIGLSILGMCEILHLIIELLYSVWKFLCFFARRGNKYRNSQLVTA